MKVIRRKSDNVVVFAGQEFELTKDGLKGVDFRAPNVTSANHEILTVNDVPEDWQGGWYTYNRRWEKTDQWRTQEDTSSSITSLTTLSSLDQKSIRGMREFLVSKFGEDPLMPIQLIDNEKAAIAERAKI